MIDAPGRIFGGHPDLEHLPERTGQTPVERAAVRTVARDVAAMPASLVVQLALWPDELARWARATRTDASVVYNALAGRKPYRAVRERLAARLDVSPGVLGQLIDATRPLPTSQRDPAAAGADGNARVENATTTSSATAVDWAAPPYPAHRTGTNPVERRAATTVAREIAALPASTVVGLALWPETLAAWSRERKLAASVVWAVLAGAPSTPVRDMLARRLGVSVRELGALIDARRQEPAVLRAASGATVDGGDAPAL